MAIIKNGITLNKAKVFSNDILGKGTAIPDTRINPSEIAVHNTGNWDVPSANYHKSLKSSNNSPTGRKASWHFSVCDKEIHQSIDTNKKAWAVGSGNSKAISIEICMFKDKNRQKVAEDNAIALIKELMRIHNIPLSKVKMHKDYTGKYCPEVILRRDGGLSKFRDRIANWGQSTAPSNPSASGSIKVGDKVKVSTSATKYATGQTIPSYVKGNTYKVTEVKSDRALLSDIVSWVYTKDLIKEGGSISTGNYPPNGDIQRKGRVLASTLNVRSGRGTNYPVIGKMHRGDVIDLYYCLNGWSSMESRFKDANGKSVNNFICLGDDTSKYVEVL